MQGKLSDLVDNLSGIFNKECKSCTKKKKKKSQTVILLGLEIVLNYKWKEYGKRCINK